jgi:hypothetical protein
VPGITISSKMNPLIQFLKKFQGTVFVHQEGHKEKFRLLPPLSDQELAELSSKLPCPLPQDIEELLRFSQGFAGTWLGEVCFGSPSGFFGLEKVFPCAIELAHDGLGNFWIVDLTKESQSWGPIFYACHDAPVVVYQTDNLLHFVQEVIREGNEPWKSEIGEVWGPLSDQIWSYNPGVLSFSHCINSADEDLKAFAKPLDETWLFVDLRNPVLGDGFSWGRFGPKTQIKRFGEKRIFAYQKKTLGRRILESLR